MWFRRKSRNRRLESARLLDVKMRSDQAQSQRTRHITLAFIAAFCVAFGLYVVWRSGEWMLNRLIYENPSFAIRVIDVQTEGDLSPDLVKRWTGVRPGENLLRLDLSSVQRNLEFVPVIRSAGVERVPPDTLRVRVTRREPIARTLVPAGAGVGIGTNAAVYLFDASGFVMAVDANVRAAGIPADDALPRLTGINPAELRPGWSVESAPVRAALRFVTAFDRSSMAGVVALHSINVSADDVLEVTTDQGSRITFGLDQLDQQIRRWRAIYDLGQRNGRHIRSLDLAVKNYPPLIWMENVPPPSNPKSPKPPPSATRNHV